MKTKLLMLGMAFFLIIPVFGQNEVLVLKKKSNNKEKLVREDKKIKIVTSDNQKIEGKFDIQNDSVLICNGDTLLLSEIEMIRTKSKATKIIGSSVAGIGALTTAGGAVVVVSTFAEGGLAVIVGIALGIPITTVGVIVTTSGVLMATIGKKHKSKKWNFDIAME